MIDIQKLKRFLSNDFDNAVLDIKKIDGIIIPSLVIEGKTKLKGKYIDIYNEELIKVKKDVKKLCNYMLENFLRNHVVIGASYFTLKQNYPDRNCFDIIMTQGIFTIAISGMNINEVFADFIKKIEFAKREGITKQIVQGNMELGTQMFLSLNQSKKNVVTGLGAYSYQILSLIKNGKIIIPNYEKKFVIKFIQEFLRMHEITDNCCFEREIMRLKDFYEKIKEHKSNSFLEGVKIRRYTIDNIVFDFYDDDKAFIQLDLLMEAIRGLKSEFGYQTFTDMIENKQLVMKRYDYGGRK